MTHLPQVKRKPRQHYPEPGVSDGICQHCGGEREGHGYCLSNDLVCLKCWKLERGER